MITSIFLLKVLTVIFVIGGLILLFYSLRKKSLKKVYQQEKATPVGADGKKQEPQIWLSSRVLPVLALVIAIILLLSLFPGLGGWFITHSKLGLFVFLAIFLFALWLWWRKVPEGDNKFSVLVPVISLFVIACLVIWIGRMFAEPRGSNLFGAQAGQERKVYDYIPREAPWIPTIYRHANDDYVVDVPLTRIWTEVRLPLKNGQRVTIVKVEPINASIPKWYEAGQGQHANRQLEMRVGERGAQQRGSTNEDWQWIPYRMIWPQTSHFIDSSLCPDGTVFGCPLIMVGKEWRFRIPGDVELCEQQVDRFYFGIDLPFGQHMAATGVYRITFSIR